MINLLEENPKIFNHLKIKSFREAFYAKCKADQVEINARADVFDLLKNAVCNEIEGKWLSLMNFGLFQPDKKLRFLVDLIIEKFIENNPTVDFERSYNFPDSISRVHWSRELNHDFQNGESAIIRTLGIKIIISNADLQGKTLLISMLKV